MNTTLNDELLQQIDSLSNKYITDSYAMSYGELVGLYKLEELIIPDFQRNLRWSDKQKSKFIESILLGIPTQSIFVYQDENGIWELVDGLQRLGTILQLMRLYKDKDGKFFDPLILKKTEDLPALEGKMWECKDKNQEIPDKLKLFIKREKININIIKSSGNKQAKFEVFMRVNTGGSLLTPQELRNAAMIMLNPEIYEKLEKLANEPVFKDTLLLSDRLEEEKYHIELLLKFAALTNFEYDSGSSVADNLDEIAKGICTTDTFDFADFENLVKRVFGFIDGSLKSNAFKKYTGANSNGELDEINFKGKFLESSFEAICCGLSKNINEYNIDNSEDAQIFVKKVKELSTHADFQSFVGSGSNAKVRIPKILEFAPKHFKK